MGMARNLRLLPQLAPDDLDGLLSAAQESTPWVASASVFLSDYQERVLLWNRAQLTTRRTWSTSRAAWRGGPFWRRSR